MKIKLNETMTALELKVLKIGSEKDVYNKIIGLQQKIYKELIAEKKAELKGIREEYAEVLKLKYPRRAKTNNKTTTK